MTATSTPAIAVRGATPLDVLRLHYAKRQMMFGVPMYILVGVLVVSAIIALAIARSGVAAGDLQGTRNNGGIFWSMIGFMVYMGVQSVATTFPLALSLGSTRRAFTLGTLLSHAALAAYVTAATLVLFAIEKLTDQWFFGFYLVDVYILGGGDLGRLIAIQFLTILTALSVGAAFSAVWVRFGNRGTTLLGISLAIVLALGLLLVVPYAADIIPAFQLWWLAVAAVLVIAASAVAQYVCLRRAAVR
jgi:hypothetical protein